jgi:hypothetical protein
MVAWQPGFRMRARPRLESRLTVPNHDDKSAQQRREIAQSLWCRSQPGKGSLAETYLSARGIHLDPWPETVRFLPARPPDHLWPTLIAGYGMPSEPEPGVLSLRPADVLGVQLTYLRHDGVGKAPIEPQKRSIGRNHSAPIVLAAMNDGLGLAIAEGIEDALSIHAETGLAAWASGGAGRMPALADAIPAYTDSVTVLADSNDAGIKGARALFDGLRSRGISCEMIFLEETR